MTAHIQNAQQVGDTAAPAPPSAARKLFLPLGGLILLAAASALNMVARPVYMGLMARVMFIPFPTPFLDLDYLLNSATCWQRGVDVYAANPCDQLDRPMTYSPLWLRMGFLAIDRGWSVPLGLGLAILFCLSLALLPPTRRWRDLAIIGLAAVSSPAVFALERGNFNVVIYLAALAAGLSAACIGPVRIGGYALLLLMGLLKFYPLAGLLAVLRERLFVCLGLALAASATFAGFLLAYRGELARMAPNIPRSGYYSEMIGAVQLPGGLGEALSPLIGPTLGPGAAGVVANSPVLMLAAGALLVAFAGAVALWLVVPAAHRRTIAAIPPRQSALLLIGGVMIVACFFAGQSVGYRGVLLLLVLPALLVLDRPNVPPALRRVGHYTILAILIVMFRVMVISALAGLGTTPVFWALVAILWIAGQLLWWWIVAVLIGLLGCLVVELPAGRDLRSVLGRALAVSRRDN